MYYVVALPCIQLCLVDSIVDVVLGVAVVVAAVVVAAWPVSPAGLRGWRPL